MASLNETTKNIIREIHRAIHRQLIELELLIDGS